MKALIKFKEPETGITAWGICDGEMLMMNIKFDLLIVPFENPLLLAGYVGLRALDEYRREINFILREVSGL